MSYAAEPEAAHRVAVLAYDRLCLFEFATVLELLRDRGPQSPPGWYRVTPVSLEGAAIRASCDLSVNVATDRELLLTADTIVVPGWRMGPVPEELCSLLQQAHRRGARSGLDLHRHIRPGRSWAARRAARDDPLEIRKRAGSGVIPACTWMRRSSISMRAT